MKKTLLTVLATTAVAAGALAQGQFAWAPSTSNGGIVGYSTDKATTVGVPVGNPAQVSTYGNLNVDFFFAPANTVLTLTNGLPNFAGWTDVGVDLQQTKISAGRMSSTVSLPVNNGQDELEVVGWAGTATSWAAASAGGAVLLGFSGDSLNGSPVGALGWLQALGDPTTTPAGLPAPLTIGANGFGGLVLEPVPEPTTIAVCGLGAAALLFFRRRK
jgi:hypothetical protein